jgi:hypothetical protein
LNSTQSHLPGIRDGVWNVMMYMNNQYNKNKTYDLGTWSDFDQGKYFFVPLDLIFIELEFSSTNAIEKRYYEISYEKQPFVCVLEIPAIETPKED